MDKVRVCERVEAGELQGAIARELGVSRQRIYYVVSHGKAYWEARKGLKGRPPLGIIPEGD